MKAKFNRIDHLLYLRNDLSVGDGTAQTMTLEQFESPPIIAEYENFATENVGGFGFAADGVDDYIQITRALIDSVAGGNNVLDFGSHHRPLFEDAISWLRTTDAQTVTVILALEPVEDNVPTWTLLAKDAGGNFAAKAMITKLANELYGYRRTAIGMGKSLGIVIRFASEMNDPGNPYGPKSDVTQPMLYQTSFRDIQSIFKNVDKGFAFCFSPALRADLPWQKIVHYYPGDDIVDFMSGTWYVHGAGEFEQSSANMRGYFANYAGNNLPRGLDELGGVDDNFLNCDRVLPEMLNQIEDFDRGLSYCVLFLNAAGCANNPCWGRGATLDWVPKA